jgi:hypothetical protein
MSYTLTDIVHLIPSFTTDEGLTLTCADKAVLNTLATFANDATHECFPGYGLIANHSAISRRQAIDSVAKLNAMGFFKSVLIGEDSPKGSNYYTLDVERLTALATLGKPRPRKERKPKASQEGRKPDEAPQKEVPEGFERVRINGKTSLQRIEKPQFVDDTPELFAELEEPKSDPQDEVDNWEMALNGVCHVCHRSLARLDGPNRDFNLQHYCSCSVDCSECGKPFTGLYAYVSHYKERHGLVFSEIENEVAALPQPAVADIAHLFKTEPRAEGKPFTTCIQHRDACPQDKDKIRHVLAYHRDLVQELRNAKQQSKPRFVEDDALLRATL